VGTKETQALQAQAPHRAPPQMCRVAKRLLPMFGWMMGRGAISIPRMIHNSMPRRPLQQQEPRLKMFANGVGNTGPMKMVPRVANRYIVHTRRAGTEHFGIAVV
jgi:hypothetical protein